MDTLLKQIKKRRKALTLRQHDMMLRIGISRQQYQRLESKGNPRLDTLALIAKGLDSELLLVPQNKLGAVLVALNNDSTCSVSSNPNLLVNDITNTSFDALDYDPWQGLLREHD